MKDTYFIIINNEDIDHSELYRHTSSNWHVFYNTLCPLTFLDIKTGYDLNGTTTIDSQIMKIGTPIFQAISTEKPEFRYVVGKDADSLLEARKKYAIYRVPKYYNTKYHRIVLYIIKICRLLHRKHTQTRIIEHADEVVPQNLCNSEF